MGQIIIPKLDGQKVDFEEMVNMSKYYRHTITWEPNELLAGYEEDSSVMSFLDTVTGADGSEDNIHIASISGILVNHPIHNFETFYQFCDSESDDLEVIGRFLATNPTITRCSNLEEMIEFGIETYERQTIEETQQIIIIDKLVIAEELRGMNQMYHIINRLIELLHVGNALIVLKPCPFIEATKHPDKADATASLVDHYNRHGFRVLTGDVHDCIMTCYTDDFLDPKSITNTLCKNCHRPIQNVESSWLHTLTSGKIAGMYGMKGCRAATMDTLGVYDNRLSRSFKAQPPRQK